MKSRLQNQLSTSFHVTSMTDVVFLLLIFFLVHAGYQFKAIAIDLPASQNEHPVVQSVHLSVTSQLDYYVENQLVGWEALEGVLKAKLEGHTQKVVVLHMDKMLALAELIKVADMAVGLGAQVAIATKGYETK